MTISALTLHRLELPFKVKFQHSSAERPVGDSALVIAESNAGLFGYGEGCPRPYVTGESWESTKAFFAEHVASVKTLCNLHDIKAWVQDNRKLIDKNPAAWCAIELSFLDLLGKEEGKSLDELLGLPRLNRVFFYTAILGISDLTVFKTQVEQYKKMGFQDYKLKIFGDLSDDRKRIAILRETIGQEGRMRFDANNVWQDSTAAIPYIEKLGRDYFAIEEPIHHNQYSELARIAERLNTKIVLDESFLRGGQLLDLEKFQIPWIINLRISKMGGILRSIEVAKNAARRGISLIIGAHVGESSILTRAALTIANAFRKNIIAQEGGFGTFLLEKDIINSPLQFDLHGSLDASTKVPPSAVGLGLPIDHKQILSLL